MLNFESNRCEEISDWLWNNWEGVFRHKFFKKIDREHSVFGSLFDWEMENKNGWRIDYLAKFQSKTYLIEAKLGKFDSPYSGFKIIAYRSAYCIDRKINPRKIGVMIFFNSCSFDKRMRYVCSVANVEYAVFNVNENVYELKECSLWR